MKQAEILERLLNYMEQYHNGLISQIELLNNIAMLGVEWLNLSYEIQVQLDIDEAISRHEFNQKLGL